MDFRVFPYGLSFKLYVAVTCLQYNSWFTFSEYEEAVTLRSRRPVHAREVAMVSANCFVQIYIVLNVCKF